MNRTLTALLFSSALAAALGACSDNQPDSHSYAGGGYDPCNAYTSCGTCTPVNGCGWCFNQTSGLCTSSPDECTNVSEFTWMWDPQDCPVPNDASVTPLDGGATVTPDAGVTETPDAGAAVSPDAGDTAAPDAGASLNDGG